MFRHWFPISRAGVERRDAMLRAEEDAIIAAAHDRATGEEREFLAALLNDRARNAAATAARPASQD